MTAISGVEFFGTAETAVFGGYSPPSLRSLGEFDEAWPGRQEVQIEGLVVPVIGRRHLIENKRASGRLKDLADVEELERLESE